MTTNTATIKFYVRITQFGIDIFVGLTYSEQIKYIYF